MTREEFVGGFTLPAGRGEPATTAFTKPFERNVLSHALRAYPQGNSAAATAFSDALRDLRVAEARLTLSLDAGEPGPDRDHALTARRESQIAVEVAYLAARETDAIREGITPQFLAADEAALIVEGLRMARRFCAGFRPSQIATIDELQALFQTNGPLDIFVR